MPATTKHPSDTAYEDGLNDGTMHSDMSADDAADFCRAAKKRYEDQVSYSDGFWEAYHNRH